MDYGRHLVLYSGGADSTYFVKNEATALYLLHYRGLNAEKTKVAVANAFRFGKRLTVLDGPGNHSHPDGEVNEFHALLDTEMVVNASIVALSFGMKGIVLGFNKNDLGIDVNSLTKIVQRVQRDFEILTPLTGTDAKSIRAELQRENVRYVSCMVSESCGYCPKCIRGY